MTPFTHPRVEQVFAAYPPAVRKKLLSLRELILRTAAATDGVGELEETFRTLFPNDFKFEGQRALVFNEGDTVAKDSLAFCIALALTYHQSRKPR